MSGYPLSKQAMLLWTGLDLYEEMQKFYRDFYSANGMTLSVIGKESIPELEVQLLSEILRSIFLSDLDQCIMQAMVREKFSTIVDKNLTLPKGPQGKRSWRKLFNLYISLHLKRRFAPRWCREWASTLHLQGLDESMDCRSVAWIATWISGMESLAVAIACEGCQDVAGMRHQTGFKGLTCAWNHETIWIHIISLLEFPSVLQFWNSKSLRLDLFPLVPVGLFPRLKFSWVLPWQAPLWRSKPKAWNGGSTMISDGQLNRFRFNVCGPTRSIPQMRDFDTWPFRPKRFLTMVHVVYTWEMFNVWMFETRSLWFKKIGSKAWWSVQLLPPAPLP